jgi:hypothetical protein
MNWHEYDPNRSENYHGKRAKSVSTITGGTITMCRKRLELLDDEHFIDFKAWVKVIGEKNGYGDLLTGFTRGGKRKNIINKIRYFRFLGLVVQMPRVFQPNVARALKSDEPAYEDLNSFFTGKGLPTEMKKHQLDTVNDMKRFWNQEKRYYWHALETMIAKMRWKGMFRNNVSRTMKDRLDMAKEVYEIDSKFYPDWPRYLAIGPPPWDLLVEVNNVLLLKPYVE